MQKLGQHFLKNAAIIQKIVDALAIADGDRVIEIGPGHGELTMPLTRAAQGKHCEIFSIEKDHTLIKNLELLTAPATIIEGDALKLLPEIVAQFPRTARYKLVGNIPYYITGKLLRTVSELGSKPERMVLLLQKEVAERICAAPPDMNRLAASVQFWANATIIAQVPRKEFLPQPDVDSAVIALETKQDPPSIDATLYYGAVRAIFAQPRKTLLNNLSSVADGTAPKGALAGQLKRIGIDPAARPQNLSVEQIIAIARAILLK